MSEGIKDLILQVDNKYGAGTMKRGDETVKVPKLCSTGSLKLDLAIGCGGIPQGRIIEMFGPPSGGKTTLSIHSMREAQKEHPDKYVAFVDVENSFDRDWAEKIGVNTDKLLYIQPFSGDEVFGILEMIIRDGNVSLAVTDSVSAMATKAELEGEYGDAHMAQLARLMSQGLKKINSVMMSTKNPMSLIWINQTRSKIGGYGNPEVTSGGNALLFYSSIRMAVRRGDVIGTKEEPTGFVTKIKLVKNKVGPPFRQVETELYIGPDSYGIEPVGEILDLAVINGIVNKGGAWFKYTYKGNEERWQGRVNFMNSVKADPALYKELFDKVSKTVLIKDAPVEGSFADTVNKMGTEVVPETEKRRGRPKKEEVVVEEITEEVTPNEENKTE